MDMRRRAGGVDPGVRERRPAGPAGRPGTEATAAPGFRHTAGLYSDRSELVEIAAPFLLEGLAAGQAAVVAMSAPTTDIVRGALGEVAGLTYLPEDHYARPTTAIQGHRRKIEELVGGGAPYVRVLAEVPRPAIGQSWDWWSRYEATANRAFADLPVWGLCAYDTANTPDAVLDDVLRTHSSLAGPDHHAENDRYEEPEHFIRHRRPAPLEAVEATPPVVDRWEPDPVDARHEVVQHAAASGLPHSTRADLAVAVSEVLQNAAVHGAPPRRVRAWVEPGRVVVRVDDAGDGPADPHVGLLRGPIDVEGGLGLWLAHNLCSDVALTYSSPGFSIRLVARSD